MAAHRYVVGTREGHDGIRLTETVSRGAGMDLPELHGVLGLRLVELPRQRAGGGLAEVRGVHRGPHADGALIGQVAQRLAEGRSATCHRRRGHACMFLDHRCLLDPHVKVHGLGAETGPPAVCYATGREEFPARRAEPTRATGPVPEAQKGVVMDDELKRYLQGMEVRLVERMTELGERITELGERTTELGERTTELGERMTELEARMIERMRDMQTELLKAYLPAQEQARLRDSALEARGTAVESRLATVENRLVEIEKKLLLNPPAA